MKKVPNERKLFYAIYNFIVASWCLLFSYGSHLNTTTNLNVFFFCDVNFSVNRNRGILKCIFTLNGTYLRTRIIIYFNILLYIAILYLTSIPVNLCKIAPIYHCHGIFHKNSGNALFKLRRHEVANMHEHKYQYQYLGN